jgi:hypothetical protein
VKPYMKQPMGNATPAAIGAYSRASTPYLPHFRLAKSVFGIMLLPLDVPI